MSRGRGRVYKQSKSDLWWVDYTFRGKRYRESSGCTRKSDASAYLNRRLSEMGSGEFIGPTAERFRWDDMEKILEDDYSVNNRKSWDRQELSLKHLRNFFGQMRPLDIRTDSVKRYITHRLEECAARSTVVRELAALKRMFKLAVQSERLPDVPYIPGIEVDNARQGFFDGETLDRVLVELPKVIQPVVQFASWTGWRKGEILPLQWSQVDFQAGTIRLEPGTTKNKEGRVFPFSALPPLAKLLEEQRAYTRAVEREQGRIIPHVFHRNGQPIKDLRYAWDSACERAGCPDAVFHDLRRTAVRNLERAGVPRSAAMKLTGHKTEAIYRRYAIVEAAMLAEGVEKLARLHAREGKGNREATA